jgi:hypothetical protein
MQGEEPLQIVHGKFRNDFERLVLLHRLKDASNVMQVLIELVNRRSSYLRSYNVVNLVNVGSSVSVHPNQSDHVEERPSLVEEIRTREDSVIDGIEQFSHHTVEGKKRLVIILTKVKIDPLEELQRKVNDLTVTTFKVV